MKEKVKHVLCTVLLFSFGFLSGSKCDPDDNPRVKYKGYLVDGDWESMITINDVDSYITITTWDETVELCFDGDFSIEFLGLHRINGDDCQEYHYNPDKDEFTMDYTYNLFIIPINGWYMSEDEVFLSVFSVGSMIVEKVK